MVDVSYDKLFELFDEAKSTVSIDVQTVLDYTRQEQSNPEIQEMIDFINQKDDNFLTYSHA